MKQVELKATIGPRMGVECRVGSWRAEVCAGSDYEGGRLATAQIQRLGSMARGDWQKWLAVHAANGKHSKWTWFGTAGETKVRGYRVAWWLPKRRGGESLDPETIAAALGAIGKRPA